ncbi:MAG: hypothetical protein ACREUO_02160 [Burkholderiales bacterium]
MEDIKPKQANDPSLFFQTLAGFALGTLVMLGVGGTVYKAVAPDGWFAQMFGTSLAGAVAAVFALAALGAFAWFTREWVSAKRRNRFSEVFVYAFAAAGLLYVAQLIFRGTF